MVNARQHMYRFPALSPVTLCTQLMHLPHPGKPVPGCAMCNVESCCTYDATQQSLSRFPQKCWREPSLGLHGSLLRTLQDTALVQIGPVVHPVGVPAVHGHSFLNLVLAAATPLRVLRPPNPHLHLPTVLATCQGGQLPSHRRHHRPRLLPGGMHHRERHCRLAVAHRQRRCCQGASLGCSLDAKLMSA